MNLPTSAKPQLRSPPHGCKDKEHVHFSFMGKPVLLRVNPHDLWYYSDHETRDRALLSRNSHRYASRREVNPLDAVRLYAFNVLQHKINLRNLVKQHAKHAH